MWTWSGKFLWSGKTQGTFQRRFHFTTPRIRKTDIYGGRTINMAKTNIVETSTRCRSYMDSLSSSLEHATLMTRLQRGRLSRRWMIRWIENSFSRILVVQKKDEIWCMGRKLRSTLTIDECWCLVQKSKGFPSTCHLVEPSTMTSIDE